MLPQIFQSWSVSDYRDGELSASAAAEAVLHGHHVERADGRNSTDLSAHKYVRNADAKGEVDTLYGMDEFRMRFFSNARMHTIKSCWSQRCVMHE